MNTNALKKFAQEARRQLLELVAARLEFVLNTDSAALREHSEKINKLQKAIKANGKEQIIDQVAYTWFNRLMALRFMDANDYQPLGVQVVSPKEGFTLPEILDEAKKGHIEDELKVDKSKIYDLLDGKIPTQNPQNEAYRLLLVAVCNHLHKIFPFLFERINDYSELLLPEDLTSEFSILQLMRDGMTDEDCQEVEVIGWLYQFYISEKKDEVFASKSKVKQEDIPAATQLFTPRWIVEYMVQNTVGKLWLQNKPNSNLRDHMPYFIESPSLESEDYLKVASVEEITLLDQACGSGHILVYGFELLSKIYEEEGYSTSEIPQLIIEKNLHGFEIDDRAAQLAGLALMMKARSYHRRFFRKEAKPNILCYQDLKLSEEEIQSTFQELGIKASEELMHDLGHMQQAKNLGSLIIPYATVSERERILETLRSNKNISNVFITYQIKELEQAILKLQQLGKKYHCVVANPPYMGGGKMNKAMSDWVKIQYPASKADLFSCFIERSIEFVPKYGYTGLVTMESWMFLSSFESLRSKLIKETKIHSLSHFGWHIMRIAFGTVSFILENDKPDESFKGIYSYMDYNNINKDIERPICFPLKDNGRYNIAYQKGFEKIPGFPIGYWLPLGMIDEFEKSPQLSSVSTPRSGLSTSDSPRFLRLWYEAAENKLGLSYDNSKAASISQKKWFPMMKGGGYRKWYGNQEYLVNYYNDGEEVKHWLVNNPNDPSTKSWSRYVRSPKHYFQKGLTWSGISSSNPSMRIMKFSIFGSGGKGLFGENTEFILGFLNSKISLEYLKVLSPTLNFEVGQINKLPIALKETTAVELIVKECITTSKLDWDKSEASWDFNNYNFYRIKGENLEESYDLYQQYWKNKFFQLHKNEEELNKRFIEIYELKDQLTPDVLLKDITILQTEIDRKALVELNKKLQRDETTGLVRDYSNIELQFNAKEVFAQFMSYAVGCLFGRYSLDKDGLILANQGESLEDYLQKIDKIEAEASFLPDDDNIIPVLDDEWFEDDIVGRFYEFLKVTFGEANFDKNRAFVETCLGKDIRKYFVKDFYKDHIKRYKKRPIYWMFSSPKGSFNVLVYLHRYTPDTLSNILNNYLREYKEKLNSEVEHLEKVKEDGTAGEQAKASKRMDKINKILGELYDYERNILLPLAQERISIDLDDGVLVNYNKFGQAIQKVAGLNDKKAKDKVRKFDWIDTSTIR